MVVGGVRLTNFAKQNEISDLAVIARRSQQWDVDWATAIARNGKGGRCASQAATGVGSAVDLAEPS